MLLNANHGECRGFGEQCEKEHGGHSDVYMTDRTP